MRAAFTLVLLLAGCGAPPQAAQDSAGTRLEAAAEQAGLVADPARATLVGSWALDTDRVCVVPGGGDAYRIGVTIDYGEGQGCAAAGTARRRGDRVAVTLGACRFDARFEGNRIVFPADIPAACDHYCTGRASLAALVVDHLSASLSEAETLRSSGGKLLCGQRQ